MGFKNIANKELLYGKSISACFYEIRGLENYNYLFLAH